MRGIVTIAVLAAGIAFSQRGSQPKDPKRTAATAKARELLDGAEGALGVAEQSVQIAAGIRLADAYRAFDRKKALDLFRQAFSAAAVLTGEQGSRQRVQFQVDIARRVAEIDLSEARTMLGAISAADSKSYDPRVWAAYRVVELLLQKEQFDQAIEVVNSLHGAYPHGAVALILSKLPEGDPRRAAVFGDAAVAYEARPDRAFIRLLARHWRSVPRRMAQSALDSALKRTLEAKDDDLQMLTIATEKESVSLRSGQDADLFELMPVVRALEPARAEEILAGRRELRTLLEAHPQGSQSLTGKSQMAIMVGGRSRAGAPPPNIAQRAKTGAAVDLATQSMQHSAAALAALKNNPQAALAEAKLVPLPARRAEILAAIASSMAGQDPAAGQSVLKDSLALVAELKEPGDRIGAWDAIAGAAHAGGDDKLAAEAIEKGMADAAELYRQDANPDKPNLQPRHTWRSTEAFLRIIRRAAALFGPEAEGLLLKVRDPDLNLLARLELAGALLDQSR